MRRLNDLVLVESTRSVFLRELQVADTYWARLQGLQFRRPLPAGEGLLIHPCRSVHTFWMRFPIDIAFLDCESRIVDWKTSVRPWRLAASRFGGAVAALEMTAGQQVAPVGERLLLANPPRSLMSEIRRCEE